MYSLKAQVYMHLHVLVCTFDRFVEHELIVEKELGTIEWKARKSIQQKEAAQEQGAAAARSKQTASVAEHMQTEENGKDIHLLEMGGNVASGTKTGKHKYTHHLR
jgi:hypothetical protein